MDLSNSKTGYSQGRESAEPGRSGVNEPMDEQPLNADQVIDSDRSGISEASDKETEASLDQMPSGKTEAAKAKSESVSRLTPEQIAFRQKKKNDYAANEFEGWPLHQLFVDYPQLFLGIATVSVFVFLLILQVHFLISLVLAIATPFGVIKLWRENPKALLITVYSFAGVIVLASAILIYTVANAEEVPRTR